MDAPYRYDRKFSGTIINNGKKVIPTISIDNKIITNPGIQELISVIEE